MQVTRTSAINLSYANTGKKLILKELLDEAQRVINVYIDLLWDPNKPILTKYVKIKVESWLSARMLQVCGKQALATMRSQRKRKVKTKPRVKNCSLDLDQRFIEFQQSPDLRSFDLIIKLSSLGKKLRVIIPSKKHKHFNQFMDQGWSLKRYGRLRLHGGHYLLETVFTKDIPFKQKGDTLGVDLGYNKLLMTSQNQQFGAQLKAKIEKISRKQRGSRSFRKALVERNNYINQEIKRLPLDNIKTVVVEDLKNVKHQSKQNQRCSTKVMNKLQWWVYSKTLNKLEQYLEVVGVQCLKVDPAYTSQTCNKCLHVDKNSRCRERFRCTSCGYEADADYNASRNIRQRGLGVYSPRK